jgi:hypothetical protein
MPTKKNKKSATNTKRKDRFVPNILFSGEVTLGIEDFNSIKKSNTLFTHNSNFDA